MDKDYKNPNLLGSFGGVRKFQTEYKQRGHNLKYNDARKALEGVDSYSIYKQVKEKCLTRPVVTMTIDHIWDLDLLIIPKDIVQVNDTTNVKNMHHSFILGAIDIFSHFVFVTPLTSKKAAVVLQGFKDILSTTSRSPHIVRSDDGGEFQNRLFTSFL